MESVNLLTTLFLTPAELKAPDEDLPSEGDFESILSGSYSSVKRKDIQQKESEDKSFPSLMIIFSTLLGQNNSFPNTSFQDIHADEIQNIQPPQLPLSLREGAVTQWQGEESSPIAPTLDRGFFQVDPSKGISTSPSILGQPVLTLNDIGTPPPVQLPMSPPILGQPVLTLNDIGTPPLVQLPMSPPILGQPVLTLNDIGTPPLVQLPTSSPIPEDIPFQVGSPASPGFSSLKQVTSSLSSSEDNISPGSGPIRHIEMPVVDSKGTHSNAMDMESNNGLLNRDPKGLERILFDLQDLVSKSEGQGGHPSEVTNILNDPKGGFDVTPVVSEELPKAVEPTHSRAEHPQIYEQIGKKIIWTLKNNEERIRLTLEPPQLGNIYMEINRGGGNIRATLWTDNPVTKEILEMNQSQLHRILKEDGFKLEKFEVFTQQDMESFRERGESLYDHSPWAKNGFRGLKASPFIEPVEITPTEMNLSHRGNNSIDVFV